MTSPAPIEEPRQLLLHQLRTLLWVERKLAEEVLPDLYEHVHAADLERALARHLLETEQHVKTLRRAFDLLHEPAEAEESPALLGLLQERDRILESLPEERDDLRDLFHADAIARAEHVEIAAYDGLVRLAQALGENEVAALLQVTLEQEQQALEQARHATVRLLAEKVASA